MRTRGTERDPIGLAILPFDGPARQNVRHAKGGGRTGDPCAGGRRRRHRLGGAAGRPVRRGGPSSSATARARFAPSDCAAGRSGCRSSARTRRGARSRSRFAVRARTDRSRPSLGTIFAAEGGPGYGSIAQRALLHPHARAAARAPRAGDGRHAGHRPLAGDRLPRAAAGRRLRRPRRRGSARASSARTSSPTGPRRRPTTSTRSGARSASTGSRSTATPTAPSSAQSYAYRHGENLEALVMDGAYPVRGESGWFASLTLTGLRSLAIVCRRSNRCSGHSARAAGATWSSRSARRRAVPGRC